MPCSSAFLTKLAPHATGQQFRRGIHAPNTTPQASRDRKGAIFLLRQRVNTPRDLRRGLGRSWSHGRHLRAVIGRLDRRQDVPADGRPGLEQVARFGLDIQHGAIRRQAGIGLDRHVGHQRASGRGRAGDDNLRAVLGDHPQHALGVGLDEEMLERRRLDSQHAVGPALDQFGKIGVVDLVAKDQGREFGFSLVGQVAPASQKLVRNPLHATAVLLRQNPNALVLSRHICCGLFFVVFSL